LPRLRPADAAWLAGRGRHVTSFILRCGRAGRTTPIVRIWVCHPPPNRMPQPTGKQAGPIGSNDLYVRMNS
jgi:hypothetical protein